jgi:hypothetical protein
MMDNAKDNDTALKELVTRFDIDIKFLRLRCLGHVIGKGVSKFERQLAGASDEEVFEIWNSQGPIANWQTPQHMCLHQCQFDNAGSVQLARVRLGENMSRSTGF